ncbi:MAG: NAD-dependent epimerase/dehydratase family protein [Acidobacteriaceae bacterium]|nr:NAD-dependent epimerase/dehydratase family protein [Acidobacteriaceae bacterium]
MRTLVIGGNGFIGTPLVRELIALGHDPAVLHRTAEAGMQAGAKQIRGDRNHLQDLEAEIRAFAPDLIVDMILSSGKQAQQLVRFAGAIDARVVAVSSMDVYRAWGVLLGSEQGELEPLPITEDSPLRSATRAYPPEVVTVMKTIFTWVDPEYDKVAVEEAVRSGGAENTIVRLPMVYGPDDPLHRMHGVLKRIADRRPAIILADDQAAWRGPRGYVENVAHAIALAATSERARGRTYHLCEEPCLSDLEWSRNIASQAGWAGKFVVMPREKTPKHLLMPVNALQHIIASSERIRSELNYRQPVSTGETIRRAIAWEQANPPAVPSFHQFDYDAEDLALASGY